MSTRKRWRRTVAAAMVALMLVAPGLAGAQSWTYTSDADFDRGELSGVNHEIVHDQLQLNVVGTTFPTLWIANAGEDTLTRFETAPGNDPTQNKEVARYKTWFTGTSGYPTHLNEGYVGASPSRTAVDIDGNAYVLNRHFDGRVPVLIKVLSDGCIDRNGNGVCDSSTGPTDVKPLVDNNPANQIIDVAEIQDERIAWAIRFPGEAGAVGRALCIDPDRNLWVGMWNSQHFYKVQASDGAILAGPIEVPFHPYGCLVDQNKILWSATVSDLLGRLDTTTNDGATFLHGGQNYAIALGKKDQLGAGTGSRVYVANLAGSFFEFDPLTSSFRAGPSITGGSGIGIAVDGNGDVVIGNRFDGGVTKFRPTLASSGFTQIWTAAGQQVGDTRGVILDANGDVWQVNFANNLSKFRGTDGAAQGVFPVGNTPYTYSDASGFAVRNVTSPTGTWTVVQDGAPGARWGTVSWTESVPAGASIQVQVRAADAQGDLPLQAFTPVGNGTPFAKSGRFIEVQSRLNASSTGVSPVLFDLTVALRTEPEICAQLIGLEGIEVVEGASITGDLASNAKVAVGKLDKIRGNVSGTAVSLAEGARIEGNVSAAVITKSPRATITGTVSTDVPRVGPLPAVGSTPGVEHVVVPKRGVKQLVPGKYRSIASGEWAEIRFAGGQYDVADIRIGKATKLVFQGATTLNVANRLELGENVVITGPGGATPPDVRINYAGSADAVFGKGVQGALALVAPNAFIRLGEWGVYSGWFWGKKLRVGKGVRIEAGDAPCLVSP